MKKYNINLRTIPIVRSVINIEGIDRLLIPFSAIKIPFILLFLLLTAVSCEKLVEADDPDSQIGTEQVFEDLQSANAALSGLYSGLFTSSLISGGSDGTGALLGTYTDDLDCYYVNNNSGALELYQNQQIPTNPMIEKTWNTAYQQIYAANSIIIGVSNSLSLAAEDKNRIKGEALLVRSLIYLYLQQIYQEIPYTETTDYQINSHLSKLSGEALLQKLEADLNLAISLLSDTYRNAERIYPNKKVAELLLAKVYLLEQKWVLAEQLAGNIIQNPLYQLEQDITKVFKKGGKHILWQLKPLNSGDSTKEASLYYFSGAAPNAYALSTSLINSFSGSDLRKQAWMTPVTVSQNTWYRAAKYKNLSGNTDEYSIIFRLEEAYFIMAEALARQNRVTEALSYLNAIRQRAGTAPLTGTWSKDAFLQELLLEVRREFFAEMGQRFMALKRFDRLGDLATIKPNWKSYHTAWPLPQKELLLNANLNPQNQGY
ncbi:RagB/SusD family nutrient uptake outer membrane protein [Chryseobacterium pennae]|uniref:RagB/SusD family nutrient uptake outer membrane protein n=1 Tax=Chryseobacterium pennae TaxID=2258962 RepID=A0A3D9C3P8_9FLAO|nr:RagB/SusD family nutrient uptake outer membrane protein [Chryseobacterium pennae]REC60485.1 RagB/SusD family nutrient uptake outer membrane protein [Chryseobacterium pennae]